jgi:hypothetical protein
MSNELDAAQMELEILINDMATMIIDPFDKGRIINRIDTVLTKIGQYKAGLPPKPALAPSKHEPEPIILAAKKRAPRAQKGH